MKSAVLAVVTVSALVSVFVGAAPVHAQHPHQAHEHGVAALRVVSEGSALEIELRTPLDNVVGFEHAPRNDVQRKALADAERRLRAGASLLQPSQEAACVLKEVVLDSPWLQGGPDDHGHDAAHAHPASASAGHAEIVAEYRFECATPERLARLQIHLFDAFPRLRELRVERATAAGQGVAILTPGKTDMSL